MLSVLSRIIDIGMAALGALLAAGLHAGGPVWLDDKESTLLAFNCVLMIMTFPSFGIYQSWRGKPVYASTRRSSRARASTSRPTR